MLVALLIVASLAHAAPMGKLSTKEFIQVVREAREQMPPCEGQAYLSESVFRLDPPPSCPDTRVFWEYLRAADRRVREDCRDLSSELSGLLRAPRFCEGGNTDVSVFRTHLIDRKKKFSNFISDEFPYDDTFFERIEKESKLPACEGFMDLALQFRKTTIDIANHHYGAMDSASDGTCDSSSDAAQSAEDYFRYLDKGEDGI